MKIAWALALLAAAALAGPAAATDVRRGGTDPPPVVTFASGPDWFVLPGDTVLRRGSPPPGVGHAQLVCLNELAPPGCPAGATLWGYPGFAWGVDLSPIPGAAWIWAPGFEGADTGADLASFLFSRKLHLPGWPSSGTLSIAADDYAAVYVNGELAGTVGSVVDPNLSGHTALVQFDITPYLHPGRNRISILAQNGPAFFAGGCDPCTYAQNPAGLVFGGTISFG